MKNNNKEIFIPGPNGRIQAKYFKNKPDIIIITSALVGGIQVNLKYPLDFLYQNFLVSF